MGRGIDKNNISVYFYSSCTVKATYFSSKISLPSGPAYSYVTVDCTYKLSSKVSIHYYMYKNDYCVSAGLPAAHDLAHDSITLQFNSSDYRD